MRRLLLCGVAIIGMALEASAADMPDFLRGSSAVIAEPGPRWDGFYVGGVVGWSVPGVDFTHNNPSMDTLVRLGGATSVSASPLGTNDSTATHFGGFVGYQQQWDGAIVGIEGTYNWLDKSVTASNAMSGSFGAGGAALAYSAVGTESAHIIDYGTIRLKGGWAVNSTFMPYATFGLAVGRMDINRAIVITPIASATTPAGSFVPAPFTVTQDINNQFGYGYAAGVGVDICLMANLFARLEYEYVQFPDFQGLNAHLHNVRAGAAFKF